MDQKRSEEIRQLGEKIDRISGLADQLQGLLAELSEGKKTAAEAGEFADKMEERIAPLQKEMIENLIRVL